ncbi:hypothetical protein H5P28_01345 [Ruficoccus amylovorans]|uniref:Uncharacterized protein n=1 Tax=Ruficoccus amylovorans TaxID=1804625 RepID=A0A842HBE8_9BACT|nr:hypothetical protein [Ruficoccus amylovorans]MBC2592894.1 hypothetical protein [Ruficoccus amylovorans]
MIFSRIQIFMTGTLLAAVQLHAQEDDIMDIRGLAGDTFWEANWPWLVPTAVVAAVVVVLLIRALVKRLNRPRPLTPRQLALKQVAEARAILDDGQPQADKRFSFAVSDALRGYLERALGLRAPEQTTEEFLDTAHRSPRLSPEALVSLGQFLQLCDLAKFARHAFGPDERERLLATAQTFIEQTDKREQQADNAPIDERSEVEGAMRQLNAPAVPPKIRSSAPTKS